MAKGTIKTTNSQQTGNVPASTIVTQPGGNTVGPNQTGVPIAVPPGGNGVPPGSQTVTGTLQDNQTGAIVSFNQPFGIQLGIAVGAKVNYQTITINGQVLANSVRLVQKGEIIMIDQSGDANNDTTGSLLDIATGNTIPFYMAYCVESGLVGRTKDARGTLVHFETVIDPSTAQTVAVALEIIN